MPQKEKIAKILISSFCTWRPPVRPDLSYSLEELALRLCLLLLSVLALPWFSSSTFLCLYKFLLYWVLIYKDAFRRLLLHFFHVKSCKDHGENSRAVRMAVMWKNEWMLAFRILFLNLHLWISPFYWYMFCSFIYHSLTQKSATDKDLRRC